MNIELQKFLYMDISTFDSLKNKGEIILQIINKILDGNLFSLNFDLEVTLEKFNERFLTYKFNKKNWIKISDMFIKGEIRHIMISNYIEESIQPYFSISCTPDIAYGDALYENWKSANNFAVSMNLKLFDGIISMEMQSNIKMFYTDTFKMLNGVVGYIDIGNGHACLYPNTTSYENSLRYGSTYYLAGNFGERCRGYHWANILTEGHIDKLGGIPLINEKSPCFSNEEFDKNNGGKALFMQLTQNINNVTEEELIRLKGYLAPILPLASQY